MSQRSIHRSSASSQAVKLECSLYGIGEARWQTDFDFCDIAVAIAINDLNSTMTTYMMI